MLNPLHGRESTEDTASGRVVLRDGSSAIVRPARVDDVKCLFDFFQALSPEARWHRFFSLTLPRPEYLDFLCSNANPKAALTLLAVRQREDGEQIIGTACYQVRDERSAEVAFVVADDMKGMGLGTLLLEHLAYAAVRNGFTHFWAVTHSDNHAMLSVFRESGLACAKSPGRGEIEIDLSLVPTTGMIERSDIRCRVAAVASLRPFFQPRGVAVVGASRDPGAVGTRLLQALKQGGYPGPLHPVNPRAAEILGIKCYATLRELPEPVELAVVAVPSAAVVGVVEDAASAGVRAVVVVSAGFAEVGAVGRGMQTELLTVVRRHGLRLIGPNCLGVLSTDPLVPLHATFTGRLPPAGNVAVSSDSGGLGLTLMAAAERRGLGVSAFVSVGNRADVSSNDLLEYWESDPRTSVILLYLESFGNPQRFARIARRVSRHKPIVALKAGRTSAGQRAAGSHTAALAARDTAVEALFHQTGVLRAETLEELFDLAYALSRQPLPGGKRVGIITNAGGPAILCADACELAGLVVPRFSDSLRARLAKRLNPNASAANPVDLIASATPEEFGDTVLDVLASGEVDSLIVHCVQVGGVMGATILKQVERGITQAKGAAAHSSLPVLACIMPVDIDQETTIPCYEFPEAPARVLGKLADYAAWRRQPPVTYPEFPDQNLEQAGKICATALADRGSGWLNAEETRLLLRTARLPVSAGGVVQTGDQAAALATRLGFPVAVKLASRTLVHKTEVGGVHLNLPDAEAVGQAVDAMRCRLERDQQLAAFEGVLVQPMVRGGVEILVGMTRDPLFGPLLAFGLGGIHVEILKDVCFRVAPLSEHDADEMLQGIRGAPLLHGYRGYPPADLPALKEVLLRLSALAEELPQVAEFELNPVFALPPGQGCCIVDARVRLAPPT